MRNEDVVVVVLKGFLSIGMESASILQVIVSGSDVLFSPNLRFFFCFTCFTDSQKTQYGQSQSE